MALPLAILGLSTYADVMLVLLVIAVLIWLKDKFRSNRRLERMRADSVDYAKTPASEADQRDKARQFQERLQASKARRGDDTWYHQKERRRQ